MRNKINNKSSIYNDFSCIRKITSVNFLFARIYIIALFIAMAVSACNNKTDTDISTIANLFYPDSLKRFKQLDSSVTGIDFHNDLKEDEYANAIVYEYTYNSGGVAIGDVNNDGLDDIFLQKNITGWLFRFQCRPGRDILLMIAEKKCFYLPQLL